MNDDDCEGLDDGFWWDKDHEDARAEHKDRVGTSECPGTMDHSCPDECSGGDACPYEHVERRERARGG